MASIIGFLLFISFAGVVMYLILALEALTRKAKRKPTASKRIIGLIICAGVFYVNIIYAIRVGWGGNPSNLELIILISASAVILIASVLINIKRA